MVQFKSEITKLVHFFKTFPLKVSRAKLERFHDEEVMSIKGGHGSNL